VSFEVIYSFDLTNGYTSELCPGHGTRPVHLV
jgi:hypothetical protein